uniref:Uncharacterized protein n=1 Tax=Glossina austeni TaxID=7395 RepID=A0A1A9UGH3_GLOAU
MSKPAHGTRINNRTTRTNLVELGFTTAYEIASTSSTTASKLVSKRKDVITISKNVSKPESRQKIDSYIAADEILVFPCQRLESLMSECRGHLGADEISYNAEEDMEPD